MSDVCSLLGSGPARWLRVAEILPHVSARPAVPECSLGRLRKWCGAVFSTADFLLSLVINKYLLREVLWNYIISLFPIQLLSYPLFHCYQWFVVSCFIQWVIISYYIYFRFLQDAFVSFWPVIIVLSTFSSFWDKTTQQPYGLWSAHTISHFSKGALARVSSWGEQDLGTMCAHCHQIQVVHTNTSLYPHAHICTQTLISTSISVSICLY